MPTFTAKNFCGAIVLQCRETGERYSFRDSGPSFPVYRENKIICFHNSRLGALAAIESNAKWAIRELV